MVVDSGDVNDLQTPEFVTATGGTVLTCGNFKTHVFTGPGSFVVSSVGNDLGSNTVEYLVVGGGGGGGTNAGGGGGAGGFRQSFPNPATAGFPINTQTYPITVGAGGPDSCGGPVGNGTNSIFSTITSAGGGSGGRFNGPLAGAGVAGGSGGGAMSENVPAKSGGAGNTPPVSPPQGNPGGAAPGAAGGGGGGASAAGTAANGINAGSGGNGSYWPNQAFGPTAPSYGTSGPVPDVRYFAGGGVGSNFTPNGTAGTGGAGGGGASTSPGTPGTVNTGGGGGANRFATAGGGSGAGGSGIVVIRYKYQ